MQLKNLNLQLKFLLPSSVIMILVIIIILISTVTHVRKMAQEDVRMIGEQTGAHLSEVIAEKFRSSMNRAETLGHVFETFQHNYMMVTRFEANRILKSFIEHHPDVLNVYVVFEPDAMFGEDAAYAYQPGHDNAGCFVPCWTRDSDGRGFLEALGEFSTLCEEPLYAIPQHTEKSTLIKPFKQRIQGEDILVSSVIVPMFDRSGKFMGIIGIDMALEDLQEMIHEVNIYEEGYLCIYTNQGDIVGGPQKDELGVNIREAEANIRFIQKVIEGKQFSMTQHSKYLDRPVLSYVMPIQIGNQDDPWMVSVNIPKNRLYAHLRQITSQIIITSLIALLVILGLHYYLSRIVTAPLTHIVERMKEIATGIGDLTTRISVNSEDEVGKLADSFNQFVEKIHEIICQVKTNTDVVAEKAVGIRHVSHQLENGATEQQQDTKQAVESIESITASIVSSTQMVHEAVGISWQAGSVTLEGLKAMQENHKVIEEIERQAAETGEIVDHLADRSDQINDIVNMIQDIAGRTKVLSLNAAIEAARAGKAGRGFSVVSKEIRALADKTAEATESVRINIDEINADVKRVLYTMKNAIAAVAQGKTTAAQTVGLLENIRNKTEATVQIVQRIDEICTQQSMDAQEILQRIQAINIVAGETRCEVVQMAGSADEMSLNSNDLRKLIYQFHLQDDESPIATQSQGPTPELSMNSVSLSN